MFSLTEDQEAAVRAVYENRCVFITGPAGTGKSVLIRHLATEAFPLQKVHLCSSTGVSAYNIKGMTVHSFIARLGVKSCHPLSIAMSPDDVIIVDEVSMLGKEVFEELSDALQRRFKTSGKPFAHFKVIFVGDFAQLPPVDDAFCFQSKYWKYVDRVIELREIKRQNDLPFIEFLLRIRSGELTLSDRRKLVELTKKSICGDEVHLYPTNDRARQHNDFELHKIVVPGCPLKKYDAKITHKGTREEDVEKFFDSHKSRVYRELHVCVGARVMLTWNLTVEEGWMNGAIGTVIEVKDDSVLVERQLDGEKRWIVREHYYRQKYTRCGVCKKECENSEHTQTVLYLDVVEKELDETISYVEICQLPLLLAWGMTIHKSQGLTLPGCVIHLYGRYTPSLFYVAISRCVSEGGVVIRTSEGIRFDQIAPEEKVMKEIFGRKEKECKVCGEVYVGPYTVCGDCCSCPSPYEVLPFTAFSKNMTKEKEEYVFQILEHVNQEVRYKKFRKYLSTLYKVFKQ